MERVHSVEMSVSCASGCFSRMILVLDSCKSASFMGTVVLHPAPTIRPITTRVLGKEGMEYANEARVAVVSLIMTATFSLGRENSLRRLAGMFISSPWVEYVCRSYPFSKAWRRLRSEFREKPFPVGIKMASSRESCLQWVSHSNA